MAWRIHNAVVRGEIDNRIPSETTAKIWLIHQTDPLQVKLTGNCWRDIAGCCLSFVNPSPDYTQQAPELAQPQIGQVGDMTASLKCRVIDDESEQPSATWNNVLYLEWFDRCNGRVLIETVDYQLSISESLWSLDTIEEDKQKLENQRAMRDFITTIIQRRDQVSDEWSDEIADEFEWEQRLRDSDRLTDAFQEVLEKYYDDPESQQKQAFAMSWDSLLDDEGSRNETMHRLFDDADDMEQYHDEERELDEILELELAEDEESEDDDYFVHPLQQKAHDCAMQAMSLIDSIENDNEPATRLCTNLVHVSAKLAGALNFRTEIFEQESGYVLAILKRCLSYHNEALADCMEMIRSCDSAEKLQSLNAIRDSIFDVRDQITELRRELNQN